MLKCEECAEAAAEAARPSLSFVVYELAKESRVLLNTV